MHRRAFLIKAAGMAAAGLLTACVAPPIDSTEAPAAAPQSEEVEQPELVVEVLAEGLDFPEGPAFDADGNLWCTELGAGNLVRLSGGKVERIAIKGRPNGLAFDRQGRAWVPDSGNNSIRRYHPASATWETMLDAVDGQPLLSPNDVTFDARGNLIFTCPNFASQEQKGYVVCLKPDGSAKKIAEGYYRPNGLDIVDGGMSLVVADTFQKALFKGAWDDEQCEWQDAALWAKVGGAEGPDGMAFGANGLLYQAIYGDGIIRVIDNAGETVDRIELPGMNPTNAAVDPSGKLGLVVTEAQKGLLLSIPALQPGAAIFDGGDAWQ